MIHNTKVPTGNACKPQKNKLKKAVPGLSNLARFHADNSAEHDISKEFSNALSPIEKLGHSGSPEYF